MFKLQLPNFQKLLKKKIANPVEQKDAAAKKMSGEIGNQKGFGNKEVKLKINLPGFFKIKKKDSKEQGIKNKEITEDKKPTPKISILNFFRVKKKDDKEKGIQYFKNQITKEEKKRAIVQERRYKLRFYLERSGLDINPESLSKRI